MHVPCPGSGQRGGKEGPAIPSAETPLPPNASQESPFASLPRRPAKHCSTYGAIVASGKPQFCAQKSTRLMKFRNIIGPQLRKLRYARHWSQSKLAIKLQCAGWDVSRSTVSKIEARLKFVLDFQLEYLTNVMNVELKELFPAQMARETVHDRLERLMNSRF